MNTREAIAARRSIRRFRPDPLPAGALDAILAAGIQAPSAKNRQPWRFTVVTGETRAGMLQAFREGLDQMEAGGEKTGSARGTIACMEQAPTTVFVHNPAGAHPWLARKENASWDELADVQSVGAAIQNMLLAAQDLGIGSLWIADVWYAYPQLNAWLETDEQMVAAVSFGIPDEAPPARPRKARSDVVREV
jgi:nitroreductase